MLGKLISYSFPSFRFLVISISKNPCKSKIIQYMKKSFLNNSFCFYGIRACNCLLTFSFPFSFSLLFSVLTMSDVSIESAAIPKSSYAVNPSKGNGTNSESHSVQITTIRLNGDNFLRWSQSVRMYIRERGKMGYLTGEKNSPCRR